tara:strand:+ start:1962 stop:2513 length:552 start_codon:yes stop_codon:yes gene_type:complete
METLEITSKTDKSIFYEIAILHKLSLKKTIASTFSFKRLSKIYQFLVANNIFKIIVAIENNKIVGCMSYKYTNNYWKPDMLLILFAHSLIGIISHPYIWLIESFYKFGLYKNVESKVNIVTLFVDKEYRNKKIGHLLLNNIIERYKNDISVDTRIENIDAIKFYKINGFKTVRKNSKNMVLLY